MAETAYIDKQKVYEEACAGCWYHGDEIGSCNLSEPCEKLVFAFASAPAADVAEVVRCKGCKYGSYDSKPDGAMVCLRTNDGFWRKETDFCSYGVKKGETPE